MKREIGKLLYSLRVRLVLLVVLALVPVLGLSVYRDGTERAEAVAHAEQDAMRLARIAIEREGQLLEGAHQLLGAIAQIPEVRGTGNSGCSGLLANILEEHSIYHNIGVIAMDGSVICSALPFDPATNLADRSYFIRAVESRGFSVGDFQVGRITGLPSVNFGLPVVDYDGEVVAVTFAAMDLSWLNRLAVMPDTPVGTVLTIADGNGTILSRTQGASEWMGRRIPDVSMMSEGGGTVEVTDVDGVQRLCAFAPLSRRIAGNTYLIVGIPTSEVFATIEHHWARDVIASAVAAILSIIATWFGGNFFIARRVRHLVEVTNRHTAGNLSARACDEMKYGRDEIGDLARALDGMADAMENRNELLGQTQIDLLSAVEATIEGWARALERRDSDTQGHTRRVAELSVRLSRAMNVPEGDIVHIRRGALLHDIGKMGIPDSILLKPGPLTDEEWVVMRRHPTYAYEWLSHIPLLKPALEIPYGHHERWDGSGYPRGLVGTQISLAARIFAVIDVYDGVTSDRPYRDAWSEERALDYIRENSGILFDPDVVTAFIAMKARVPADAQVVYHKSGNADHTEEPVSELTT